MKSAFIKRSWVIAAGLVVAACGEDTANVADLQGSADTARCERSSWVAGSTELCEGMLIYRDYVYDDFGADAGVVSLDPAVLNVITRGGHRGSPLATTPSLLAPSAGDQRYPAGLENTADLVKLSLAIEGDELVVDFELNTMFNAGDALAAIAIDTDNNPATGGGDWTPLQIRSSGWEVLEVFDQGEPASNRITGRLPVPDGETWRVQAAVAQRDGTVMNVAFRGVHEQAKADATGPLLNNIAAGHGNFWEDLQAAALASGDISPFAEVVRVDDLRNGVSREAPPATGFIQRVYTSAYTLGEGVSLSGVPGRHGDTQLPCEQYFNYLGKYQPYGVYIPAGPGPHGIQMVLHGCEANHASQINQRNMQQQFGEGLNRILVSPLGRGPYGFYSDISERDVLDVLADVEANYASDAERVFMGGYSMGGYGAMRLAALYPDRFAGLISWVGFTGDLANTPLPGNPLPALLEQLGEASGVPHFAHGAGTGSAENIIDFLGNLQHVPGAYLYGALDELVQVTTSLALAQRLDSVGVPYQFFEHTLAEHLTLLALDDWQKEADALRDAVRVSDPVRVHYRMDPAFDFPEYGIVHNRAYWVSDIVARDAGESLVDLRAPACGGPEPAYTEAQTFGFAPVPWLGTERRATGQQMVTPDTVIEGRLHNVAALNIDAAATCLDGRSLRYVIESDGPATLLLSDGRRLELSSGANEGTL